MRSETNNLKKNHKSIAEKVRNPYLIYSNPLIAHFTKYYSQTPMISNAKRYSPPKHFYCELNIIQTNNSIIQCAFNYHLRSLLTPKFKSQY
jgi:hypothetical protein